MDAFSVFFAKSTVRSHIIELRNKGAFNDCISVKQYIKGKFRKSELKKGIKNIVF